MTNSPDEPSNEPPNEPFLPAVTGGTTSLPALSTEAVAAEEAQSLARIRSLLVEARSENTRQNYQRAWSRFELWCAQRGYAALPTDGAVLTRYLEALLEEGVPKLDGTPGKPVTLSSMWVHLSAICFAHTQTGHPSPVDLLPAGFVDAIQRRYAKPPRKKRYITLKQLNDAVGALPEDLKGLRDRALLLIAFASGGRRRSEMAAMRFEELSRIDDGYIWTIPKSKTKRHSFEVAIPQLRGDPKTCPARALDAWLKASGIKEGPVFPAVDRHGNLQYREGGRFGIAPSAVASVVKSAVASMGLDPALYGAHSLRHGFVTEMARKGLRLEQIMERTGHESTKVVLGYIASAKRMTRGDPVLAALEREDEE